MSRPFLGIVRFANLRPHRITNEGLVAGGIAEIVVVQSHPKDLLLCVTEDVEPGYGSDGWEVEFEGTRAEELCQILSDIHEKGLIPGRFEIGYSWCNQDRAEDVRKGLVEIDISDEKDAVTLSVRPNEYLEFGSLDVAMTKSEFKRFIICVKTAVERWQGEL